MATAVHRSTPASSTKAPDPHNTATVLEFRCMFTHDLLKKQKKWHDGSLRFHTFNRRVMVYDDSKNFVGDQHYRQQEQFGEGLELRLDRPVLVQVEEPLGQSKTDLTPLLGRHNQDASPQSNNPSQPTRATLARINAANSQIKPKSIKDLLGASQGRYGRARLLTQSPFEQRQALSEVQPSTVEPPAKRQKTVKGKENELLSTRTKSINPGLPAVRSPEQASEQSKSLRDVVDISSDDDLHLPVQQALKKVRETSKPEDSNSTRDPASVLSRKSTKPIERHSGNAVSKPPPKELSSTKKQAKISQAKEASDVVAKPVMNNSVSATPPLAASLASLHRLPLGPRTSLKFTSTRPRPKLMYAALLTGTSRSSSGTSDKTNPTSNKFMSGSTASQPSRPSQGQRGTKTLDTDTFFAASQIAREAAAMAEELQDSVVHVASAQDQSPEATVLDDPPVEHADHNLETSASWRQGGNPPDSPLFMPRTTSQMSPITSQRQEIGESGDGLSQNVAEHYLNQTMSSQKSYEEEPLKLHNANHGTNPDKVLVQVPRSPTFSFAEPPSYVEGEAEPEISAVAQRSKNASDTRDTKGESTMPTPARKSPRNLPPKSRLFRRVVSENYPPPQPTQDELSPDDLDEDDLVPSADLLNVSARRHPSLKKAELDRSPRRPALLHRTTSDPIAITTITPTLGFNSSLSASDETAQSQQQPQDIEVQSPPPETLPLTAVDEGGPWTTTEAFLLFDWWPPGKQKPDYGQGECNGKRNSSERVSLQAVNESKNVTAMSKKKYGMFGSARLVSQG